MSVPSIYNKNGQILTDQTFTIGESSNKVASAKFVVDTVTSEFTTRVTPLTNTVVDLSNRVVGLNTKVVDLSSTVVGLSSTVGNLKQATDSSFVKLGNGSITVGNASNIVGGLSGEILYQLGPGVTRPLSFTGTGNKLLRSTGVGVTPSWEPEENITVGKATNIARVGTNQLLYQQTTDSTNTIAAAPDSIAFLKSTGTNATPSWEPETSITVENARNIVGGLSGELLYQLGPGVTRKLSAATGNTLLRSTGVGSTPSWQLETNIIVGKATHLAGGSRADGYIPYQEEPGVTKYTTTGANAGSILTSGYHGSQYNTAPEFVSPTDAVLANFTPTPVGNTITFSLPSNKPLGYATWTLNKDMSLNITSGSTGGVYNIEVTVTNSPIIKKGPSPGTETIIFSSNSVPLTSIPNGTYLLTITKFGTNKYYCNFVLLNATLQSV